MSAALADALAALAPLAPEERVIEAARRLGGGAGGPLGHLAPGALDGALLEAVCADALGGARGAVFTPPAEARLLAALGLAHLAAARGGPAPADGLAALLAGAPAPGVARALEGAAVLDPACGGGALLAAAARLAGSVGARLRLRGIDVAPLAALATRARLALAGAEAEVSCADAAAAEWPAADLVLANPPFLRHEAMGAAQKARAAAASGLTRQADLSAHLAALALRRAPVAALVWPRALDVSRSAAPLREEARARGGFVVRLRSRAAGSFAASVDTALVVWVAGGTDTAPAEASVPLEALSAADLGVVVSGGSGPRITRPRRGAAPASGAVRVGEVCDVRFGTKSGCNGFFHLAPLGGGRYASALVGEVRLADDDVLPLLASLRDAPAPAVATPGRVLFRPARDTATARAYVRRGEALGVDARATCRGRSPWWRLVPGRTVAPVLYPAKVGARAFGFLNADGLWEDKKWHALFPRMLPAWQLAAGLCATPVRLAIDEAARQLTGAQAIADVDTGVLAGAPFPAPAALARRERALREAWEAVAREPVTTALEEMLARPEQRALDRVVGEALGLGVEELERQRRALVERVRGRLQHAAAIRGKEG